MLKLFFHIRNQYLRVRIASPNEVMGSSLVWNDKIEFSYTESADFTMSWASLLPDLEPHDANALVNLVSARYPVSAEFERLRKICPKLSFPTTASEWVFFGGTFNPWHQGHQACLKLLPDELTCFVVPDQNPFKDLRKIDPPLAVLELIARIKFKSNQFLVPTFLLDNERNPTINWIERLKTKYPDKKLSLLLGYDSFSQITTWTRAHELLNKLHTLYVASRLENDQMREVVETEIKKCAPKLNIVFLGRHDFEGMSSTNLRNKKGP